VEKKVEKKVVKISRAEKRFTCLETKALSQANILERQDLQEYIFNSFEAFCQELGQDLMIVAQEVTPSETVADRIDLLAVDDDGSAVIIELKRGNDKLQLLQAIAYAGMIAKWSQDELLARAGKDRVDAIKEWIDDSATINQSQRILLVAEA
jgi:RecB family endonuclease NucS